MWSIASVALDWFKGKFKTSTVVLVAACASMLLLWQCSQSSLEALRHEHQALRVEYEALEDSLTLCREAASLHDAISAARELENQKISAKYNRLRDELTRAVLPTQTEDSHAQNSDAGEAKDYPGYWSVQLVPNEFISLLTGSGTAAGVPVTPGAALDGNSPAGEPGAGAQP